MTAVSQLPAGARLLASLLQGIAPQAAYKGADETVTSSTTVQNDDALFLASLPANSTWAFLLWLWGTGAANGSGDLKGTFTWPAGASGAWSSFGYATTGLTMNLNAARNSSGATPVPFGLNGATPASAIVLGSLAIAGTGGTLQWQWAQNTSSGTGTTVKAGSWLAAWQVA